MLVGLVVLVGLDDVGVVSVEIAISLRPEGPLGS